MDFTGSELNKKLSEAKGLLKKATEATKTSFLSFRFSEDWISAARYSRDAVAILRRCGAAGRQDFLAAIDLMTHANSQEGHYSFSGTAQEEKGNYLSKLAESESDPVKKTQLITEASEAHASCAKYFGLAGQLERSCTAFLKAAQLQRDHDNIPQAIAYAEAACKLYENQSKLTNAEKPLRQALIYILESGDYERAIGHLYFQNGILGLSRGLYANNIHKNYYSEIVLLVYLKQYDRAQQALEKHSFEDGDFSNSSEYHASATLIDYVTKGDPLNPRATSPEVMKKYKLEHPAWKFLERPISLLINKIECDPTAAAADEVFTPGEDLLAEFGDDPQASMEQQLKELLIGGEIPEELR